jgi:hypothetical protein
MCQAASSRAAPHALHRKVLLRLCSSA